MKKTILLIIVAVTAGNINGYAEEPSDTININEVVITGNRVEVSRLNSPLTISVISSDEILSQEEANILPVVAKRTPSLFVSEIGVAGYALGNGTSGQITIRGVGGSPNARVLMLVDGQPQYMGVFGHPLPNFHMASNVERVEVVRGPASLLYGSNAMGGVINVITKKQQNEGLSFRGHAAYGSFNTMKTGVSAGYSNGNFSAGVNVNHNQTDGHRDSTEFSITNVHAYAGLEINRNWSVRAGLTWADYSFMDPGSSLIAEPITFLGDITRRMATLSVKNNYESTMGGVYLFYNSGNHDFSDGWVSADVNNGVNIYQSMSLWDGGTVTAGIDMKRYGGEGSFGFFSDTFITVNESAGYLMAEQKIGSLLNFTAGARYESHSNFGAEVVPQFGITVRPDQGTIFKALASKGFRSPTIMEMYLFAPNEALEPERLWNYELSATRQIGQVGIISASAYMINGSNLIIMEQNLTPPPPVFRVNGGEFSNWGIELESTFYPVKALQLDLNYSYLNADTKLYFAPEHQLFAGAMYHIGDFRLSASVKSIRGLYTLIDNGDPANDIRESYLLADMKVSYRLMEFMELFIAGKNLLNQDYQTVNGYQMPGINAIGGISVKFN
ncbi:MAG: TonB-dependent receptor [Bacteroidales bacterium]